MASCSLIQEVERLPFEVRVVTSAQDLGKAVEIRASAYGRHMPDLGRGLRVPEAEDLKPDVLVLLAERKIDGRPIGSIRLQGNALRPLRLQGETDLLDPFASARMAESTRLGVEVGADSRLVTAALIKASYQICRRAAIRYNVVGGRRSMAQVFRALQFDELPGGPFPISFGNNIPHWIFVLPVDEFEARLERAGHWYHPFFSHRRHPDLDLDWARVDAAFGAHA